MTFNPAIGEIQARSGSNFPVGQEDIDDLDCEGTMRPAIAGIKSRRPILRIKLDDKDIWPDQPPF